jgi:RNase P/RNase MRP subunit POP5
MTSFSQEHAAENIIRTLIDLPEFLRKPMLEGRLREFYLLNEQDKREVVSDILEVIPLFEGEKISALVKTWLVVLSKLDAPSVVEISRLYCQAIRNSPEIIQKMPVEKITETFVGLDDAQKQKLADCLKEAILSVPNKHKIITLIPESGLRALGMK